MGRWPTDRPILATSDGAMADRPTPPRGNRRHGAETIRRADKGPPIMETPTVETAAIIVTRYFGPTNHKPGRIKATAGSGKSLTISWDHAVGTFENHAAAAAALAKRIGISGRRIVGGGLPRAGYAFAFVAR